MPKKLPYLPLYTGDWMKDPAVTLCSPATRGVWIDLLCAMHDLDRSGELRGTAEQLARIARCLTVDLVQALTDLQATGAADVTERNGVWFVCNRRMRSEYKKRKANAERQLQRRHGTCRAPCSTEVSLSEDEIEIEFEKFWEEFPKGRKGSKGTAREAFVRALHAAPAATLIAAAAAYAKSEVGRGKFVKMPSTWLNQECWNDDPAAWQDKDMPAKEKPFQELDADTFAEWYRLGKFKEKPTRHTTDKTWVFGVLRDGTKVECRNYPAPKTEPTTTAAP